MRFNVVLGFALAVQALPTAPANGSGYSIQARQEEAEDPNKIDQAKTFGKKIALQGGNIQQDTTFPSGNNGVLEIEFSNADGRKLKVVENKNPAAPPAGFVAVESSSYKVKLSGGSPLNLTVSKVDYIRNANSTLDISQGRIGRFDNATNTFIVDDTVGELEFEAEENELSLKVDNMNGEWGIFVPQGTAAAATAATNTTAKAAASASASAKTAKVADVATGSTTTGSTTTGSTGTSTAADTTTTTAASTDIISTLISLFSGIL